LLTAAERAFFGVLENLLEDRYRIFPKMHLADLLAPTEELPDTARLQRLEQLPKVPLDFVICDAADFSLLAVVMLDPEIGPDSGPGRRQNELDRVLTEIGLPVIRLPLKETYRSEEVKIEISRSLFIRWRDDTHAEDEIAQDSTDYGRCPVCGSPFVKRLASRGKFAGRYFLICARYPQCKHLRLLKETSPMANFGN
jgi:hypothetical protein